MLPHAAGGSVSVSDFHRWIFRLSVTRWIVRASGVLHGQFEDNTCPAVPDGRRAPENGFVLQRAGSPAFHRGRPAVGADSEAAHKSPEHPPSFLCIHRQVPAHHHIFFPPRPEVVVGEKKTDGFAACAGHKLLFHSFFSHQPYGPAGETVGRVAADHGDDTLLLPGVQHGRRTRTLLLV